PGAEVVVSAGFQRGDQFTGVLATEPAPPVHRGHRQVRYRREDVVHFPAGRGERRVGTGGVADEQGRVAHQLAAADHLVEGTPPGSTEVDVVVRDAPVPLS